MPSRPVARTWHRPSRSNSSWHRIGRRYPNAAGTNPRPPISLLDASAERRITPDLLARVELRDLTDERAEFIAGPSLGTTSVEPTGRTGGRRPAELLDPAVHVDREIFRRRANPQTGIHLKR